MPILIAGIAWLAEFLVAALAAAFVWILQFFTKRTALIAYAITAIVALSVVFFAAMGVALSYLQAITPPGISQALGLVVPSNFSQCASAVLAAHVARWVYVWQVKFVLMKSN